MNDRLYLGDDFLIIGDHHKYLLHKVPSFIRGAGLLAGMHDSHDVKMYDSD
jgi:hypothetical protein